MPLTLGRSVHAAGIAFGLIVAGLVPFVGAHEAAWVDDWKAASERPEQNRKLPGSACSVAITETLAPNVVPLCESAQVTVELGVSCPMSLPLHVVLVMGHHLAMEDHLDDVKRAARELVDGLDFATGVKVGLVGISGDARVVLPLTDSKSDALSAINRLRLDPVNPFVQYFDWVGGAQDMLERERDGTSPQEVIVVYSTGCPNGFDSYCTRQVASANQAQGAGMMVVGVCNPNARPFGFPLPSSHCRTLQQMASPGRYHDLAQASRASEDLADLRAKGSTLGIASLEFRERLAADWRVVPDSAAPVPDLNGGDMVFGWEDLTAGQVVSASYRVSTTVAGALALRESAGDVAIVDTLDRGWDTVIPSRSVTVTECVPPTATPSPTPTSTPTQTREPTQPARTATPTPTPAPASATPIRQALYLPIAMQRVCLKAVAPVDAVLLIDTSSSMAGDDGGISKFEAAKRAARTFVEVLHLGRDRATVVGFDAVPNAPGLLTASEVELLAAIDGLSLGSGTRLDLALAVAQTLLADRDGLRTQVVVLLTDGRPDLGTETAAKDAARTLTRDGVRLFAVGLGSDVDAELLEAMAGDDFIAASAESIEAAYHEIAATVPCPNGRLRDLPLYVKGN